MFDFSIAPEIQELVKRVRRFVDEVVIPAEAHAFDDPVEGLPPAILSDLRAQAKAAAYMPRLCRLRWAGWA